MNIEHRTSNAELPTSNGLGLSKEAVGVLRCVALGVPQREISAQLGISKKTVQYHVNEICQRSGVRGIACLARLAVGMGLVGAIALPAEAAVPKRRGPVRGLGPVERTGETWGRPLSEVEEERLVGVMAEGWKRMVRQRPWSGGSVECRAGE